ncbi:MAG: HNH endonuclease signature motif containing protein, partial [Phycicoccus sp.]
WSAVDQLAADYRAQDGALTVGESRADAFGDLLLRNVAVTAKVTLGVPVGPGPGPGPGPGAGTGVGASTGVGIRSDVEADVLRHPQAVGNTQQRVELRDDDEFVDDETGDVIRVTDLSPAVRERLSWVEVPDAGHPCGGEPESASVDPRYVVQSPVDGGCSVSGVELPGLGWVDPATVAAILATMPVEVGRAVLDAGPGTLVSHTTSAYTPTKAIREYVQTRDGTCRMWGCFRRATRVDLDHVRPRPAGATSPQNLAGLCRRHHRMKQRGRWRYRLHPDGTVEWVSDTGKRRVTEPLHRTIPPSEGQVARAPKATTTAPDESPPF